MRYDETHKQETHCKLVRAAARFLREKGPDRLSVADVMRAAGLTHGGFYAHFRSKDALLAEALSEAFARSAVMFRKTTEGMPPRHALATFIDLYVSPAHRDNPAGGCPIAALSSDVPRQSKRFRMVFQAGVDHVVAALAMWIAELGYADPPALAGSIFSAMAGAVSLSRTISDVALSDELLISARATIKARLDLSDPVLSKCAHPKLEIVS